MKFLFLGETPARFQKINQLVDRELLPLQLHLETNLSKALTDLHCYGHQFPPQVILLNVDAPLSLIQRFIEQLELLFAPLLSQTLLFLSGDHSSTVFADLSQRFPFISGFVEKPFERLSIEQIVAKLLGQFEKKIRYFNS
ncbi:MAG: hypothetical protein AAF985_22130 [Bacteroidota bacterium]